MVSIIIKAIAAFLAVYFFSITLEVNKKFLPFVGITGMAGWLTYLICKNKGINDTTSYIISGLVITTMSSIFSGIFKTLLTIFLIPGILPIVPGVAIYKMVYNLMTSDIPNARYYFIQTILISVGIAVSIFLIESLYYLIIVIKRKIVKKLTN